MNHLVFPMKDSQSAIRLKMRLQEDGIASRVLIDPLSSMAPALADRGELFLEVEARALEKLGGSLETLISKVS